MTQQTLKKQLRIRFAEILEDRGIVLSADIANVLADVASEIVALRQHKDVTCPRDWLMVLHKLCGVSVQTAAPGMRKQLSECGIALIGDGAELDDLDKFSAWFARFVSKWTAPPRYPTPAQVRNYWAQFKAEGEQCTCQRQPLTPESAARAAREEIRL